MTLGASQNNALGTTFSCTMHVERKQGGVGVNASQNQGGHKGLHLKFRVEGSRGSRGSGTLTIVRVSLSKIGPPASRQQLQTRPKLWNWHGGNFLLLHSNKNSF